MTISFAQSRKILTINITLQTINIFFGLPGTSTMWRENLDQSSQRKLKKLFLVTTNFKEDPQHKMQVWATHFYYEMIMNSSQCLLFYTPFLYNYSEDNCTHAGEFDTTCSRLQNSSYMHFSCLAWVFLILVNDAAHARLMYRNEVTQLDAITAILCVEASMTTSAIVDSVGNALHSNFAENPDQECILVTLFAYKNFPAKDTCYNQ